MNRKSKDFSIISRILEYCIEIEDAVDFFGNTFESFSTDKIYRNATTMCILQISELTGRLSQEFIMANPEIP